MNSSSVVENVAYCLDYARHDRPLKPTNTKSLCLNKTKANYMIFENHLYSVEN